MECVLLPPPVGEIVAFIGGTIALVGFFVLLAAQWLFSQMCDDVVDETPRSIAKTRLVDIRISKVVHELHARKYPDKAPIREREEKLSTLGFGLVLLGAVILAMGLSLRNQVP